MEWVRLILGHLTTSRKFPYNEVHCKMPHIPKPSDTSLLGIINFALRHPRLTYKKWDPYISKIWECHLLAHLLIFCLRSVGLKSHRYLQKWKNLTKNNPKLQWPFKIIQLKHVLESRGTQIKQNGIHILIGMQKLLKASGFQNSFIERFTAKG